MTIRSARLLAGGVFLLATACHTRDVEDARRPTPPASSTRPASAAVLARDFDPDTLVPGDAAAQHDHDHGASYTCTHHPDVEAAAPGKCPRCGMSLVPRKKPEVTP